LVEEIVVCGRFVSQSQISIYKEVGMIDGIINVSQVEINVGQNITTESNVILKLLIYSVFAICLRIPIDDDGAEAPVAGVADTEGSL